jgi:hypothetical protein
MQLKWPDFMWREESGWLVEPIVPQDLLRGDGEVKREKGSYIITAGNVYLFDRLLSLLPAGTGYSEQWCG